MSNLYTEQQSIDEPISGYYRSIQSFSSSPSSSSTDSSDCSSSSDSSSDGESPLLGPDVPHALDNKEFKDLFKRISRKFGPSCSSSTQSHINCDLADLNSKSNSNPILTSTLSIKSLKYLYKLLALYKLEIYLYELCEAGYYTTISLHNLSKSDLTILNVSPYDKKKFLKLQLFIKQVMNTINVSTSNKAPAATILPTKVKSSLRPSAKTKTPSSFSSASTSNLQHKKTPSSSTTNKMVSKVFVSNETSSSQNFSAVTRRQQLFSKSTTSHTLNTKVKSHDTRPISSSNLNRVKAYEPRSLDIPAVNHPKERNIIDKKSNNSNHKPIKSTGFISVKSVESRHYDYGVPKVASKNTNALRKKQQQQFSKQRAKSVTNASVSKSIKTTSDIYVYARKRPKLACEANFRDIIDVKPSDIRNPATICVNEMKSALDGTPVLKKNEFAFDKTFDATVSNDDLFNSSVLPFIHNGSNGTIKSDFTCICFGQTGSGKTHTLFGNKQNDGLCALTAKTIFSNNDRIFCGFYEIYNGQLYDLLNKKNRLVLREDSNGHVNVVGLVELEIKSLTQLRKTIDTAQSNRHIGCTSFNKASSRSHAVVQFCVPNLVKSSGDSSCGQVVFQKSHSQLVLNAKSKVNSGLVKEVLPKYQRLIFIDLAGSERGIDAQNNQKDNRKEGAEINQSLLALKECIRCMDQFCSYAPFRQSKLTRVLRDCFIGSGKTILISTVSPTDDCASCSMNTLQYANRVRQMTLRNRDSNNIFMNKENLDHMASNIKEEEEEVEEAVIETECEIEQENVSNNVPIEKVEYVTENNKKSINHRQSNQINNDNIYKEEKEQIPSNKPKQSIVVFKPKVAETEASKSTLPAGLFHPSKINMSSTPIKTQKKSGVSIKVKGLVHAGEPSQASTPIKNKLLTKIEKDCFFDNDTPIKGHKIKHITTSSRSHNKQTDQNNPTERYLARVTVPDYSKKTNDQINNDELNTSIKDINDRLRSVQHNMLFGTQNQQQQPTEPASHLSTRLRLANDVIDVNNTVSNNDDSLFALRQKQKDLFRSRHKFLSREKDIDDETQEQKDQETSSIQSFSQKDSKKQLRTYVQNLESKLKSLRVEMDTSFQMASNCVDKNKIIKKKETAANGKEIDSSCDSLKELVGEDSNQLKSNKNVAILHEFLERRSHLEKQQKKIEIKSGYYSKFNSQLSEHEKENNKDNNIELDYLQNESQQLSSSEENLKNNFADFDKGDLLNCSMHKGNNNQLLFSQIPMSKSYSARSQAKDVYGFLPIFSSEKQLFQEQCIPHTQELTTTNKKQVIETNHQLLNPKPIRLNCSSSFDSGSSSLSASKRKNLQTNKQQENQIIKSQSSSQNTSRSMNDNLMNRSSETLNLVPSNVKMSKGKIWNEPKQVSKQEAEFQAKNCWSSDSENKPSEITKINVVYSIQSIESDRLNSSTNKLPEKETFVEAHAQQLSDITETCKKEMNLLSSLKDSQMGYEDYLNQLESMLSKKAHSIRGLQSQITQLKTCHYEGHPMPFHN